MANNEIAMDTRSILRELWRRHSKCDCIDFATFADAVQIGSTRLFHAVWDGHDLTVDELRRIAEFFGKPFAFFYLSSWAVAQEVEKREQKAAAEKTQIVTNENAAVTYTNNPPPRTAVEEAFGAFTNEMHDVFFPKLEAYSNAPGTSSFRKALGNFYRAAEATGCTPLQVWLVYFMKHVEAAKAFARTGAAPEPIRGRLIDIANYAFLGSLLAEEES